MFADDVKVSKGMVKYACGIPKESIVDVGGILTCPEAKIDSATQKDVSLTPPKLLHICCSGAATSSTGGCWWQQQGNMAWSLQPSAQLEFLICKAVLSMCLLLLHLLLDYPLQSSSSDLNSKRYACVSAA
jgi:hypothetical protein